MNKFWILILLTCSLQSTVQSFTLKPSFPAVKLQESSADLYHGSLKASPDEIMSVDRSLCIDTVCSSDPEAQSLSTSSISLEDEIYSRSPGQAIQRLGVKSVPTVWSFFGHISSLNPNIANLGQGFPDWLPPKFAIDALVSGVTDTAQNSPHQYTRPAGHPKLVKELAGRYSKHLKKNVDAMNEVAITVGASQALYLALQTRITEGDEVILFEPFFDLYENQIKLAGGIPVYVPLTFVPYSTKEEESNVIQGGEWVLEEKAIKDKITSKTKVIILNSPHNPTGKIFTRQEMNIVADAVTNLAPQDCVVLSDEVYKYIVHSPPKDEIDEDEAVQFEETLANNNYQPTICQGHVHFASLPGMWNRTITISSAGKTFSATGWQVGWAIGPSALIAPIHTLLPYIQFCPSTVIQEALARALPLADLPYEGYDNYYEYLKAMYTRKRDLLSSALKAAGFAIPNYNETPGGGFFIFARIGKDIADSIPRHRLFVKNPAAPNGVVRPDWALCQWLAEEKGILCIPASPFFSNQCPKDENGNPISDQFVRIAFCKTNDTIKSAADVLLSLKEDSVKEGINVLKSK
jgi:kynurenine--oxoglutarate transaminase/cysteine-S-conjugate beta-lyase/glutamine--phenylpyruvate transaminase